MVIAFIVIMLWLVMGVPISSAVDRYVKPTANGASGTACTNGNECTLQQAVLLSSGNDRIRLQNGTNYNQATDMLDVPTGKNGTSAALPLTVEAINDGQVLINGMGSFFPFRIPNGNYWLVQGIDFCCSKGGTVIIGQYGTGNVVKRVVGWNAKSDTNASIFNTWSTTGTYFEDIVGMGTARKTFVPLSDTDTTLNRGYFLATGTTDPANHGVTPFSYTYDSQNVKIYDIIVSADLTLANSWNNNIGIIAMDHYNTASANVNYTVTLDGLIAYWRAPQILKGTNQCILGAMNQNNILPNPACPPGDNRTQTECENDYQDAHPTANHSTVTINMKNAMCLIRSDTATIPTLGFNFGAASVDHAVWDQSRSNNSNWVYSKGLTADGGATVTQTKNTADASWSNFSNGLLNRGLTTQPTDESKGAWMRYQHNRDGTLNISAELFPWPMEGRITTALSRMGSTRGLDGNNARSLTALVMELTKSTLDVTETLHLTYESQPPASVEEDKALIGFEVCVYNATNTLQTGFTQTINVSFGVNNVGAVLSGTKSLPAIAGCITFNGLKIDIPATDYVLRVTSAGVTAADSNVVIVTATPTPGQALAATMMRTIPVPQ